MADHTPNLGHTPDASARRDAVHVCIAPVVAAMELQPGEHVALRNGYQAIRWNPTVGEGAVGIIDPFLLKPVQAGERCWLLLYPGSITSLRHVFTHPAFSTAPPVAKGPHDEP